LLIISISSTCFGR